jgi:hypothetical protein
MPSGHLSEARRASLYARWLFLPCTRTSENAGRTNFSELRQCELRRITLPRTWVNKGMEKGRGLEQPRPAVTSPVG